MQEVKQEKVILKVIDWAQKHRKTLEELTLEEVIIAIRSK